MGQPETALDLNHLDRYTGGDPRLNQEILLLFESQCHEMLEKLESLAGEAGDGKSWRMITHTLKGAARGVGAFALADAAAEAEKAGQDRMAAIGALERIKCKSAAVQSFIEEFLKKGA